MGSRDHHEGTDQLVGMSDRRIARSDQPELLENVYLDSDGVWRTSGGYVQVTPASFTREVIGLHWFGQGRGGRQRLLLEYVVGTLATVGYVDFTQDLVVALESSRTRIPGPSAGSTFFTEDDWCYVLNGIDAPIRWDGREVVQVGFLQPPPPPTVNAADYDQADTNHTIAGPSRPYQQGVGVEGDSTDATAGRFLYGYAIQAINDRGMVSPRSVISWVHGENDTNAGNPLGVRGVAVRIPSLPGNCRAVRLLRTANLYGTTPSEAATLYEVGAFAAAGSIDWVDERPDSELILTYDDDSVGLWPVEARHAAVFRGVLFVDDGVNVRYSAPSFIEQMPPQNTLLCGSAATGKVVGMKVTRSTLIVFKRRGIYLVTGNPLDGFHIDALDEDIGCASPRSIVEVPGLGVVFLAERGPYVIAYDVAGPMLPQKPVFIGDAVSDLWKKRVNEKALVAARAGRHVRDREVWFQVPQYGDDRPALTLVLHHEVQGWSVRTGFTAACFSESLDHQSMLFFGSWDNATSGREGVFVYSKGSDQNGTEVTTTILSPWLRVGRLRALPYEVELSVVNTGRDITFTWRSDRTREFTGPSDTTHEIVDYEKERPRWGTATWDVDPWEPTVPVLVRAGVHADTGREFQWRLVGTKVAIFGYSAVFRLPSNTPQRGPVT